ncbi:hypothetical protein C3486_13165 [Streptomyces sp. Ru73]|uniref:hypothetical protein n=1 Tax=Streptomyces sp. Ru73 TaxID=2080748 RepID=UPI000CDDE599|nr:hypothetical protein [Streptomyces sp. Ru73]POX40584.1 hypothetical protein C3486_13165 [Streptomyces sp. Ru73]
MRAQRKAAAWCGRLLLFAALVAGIVTMHTFGHPMPEEGHGAAVAVAAHTPSGHATAADNPMAAGPVAQAPPHAGGHASAPGPHGMDPGSVCLAVLSVGALALLAAGGLLVRRRSAELSAAAPARLLRALWPNPPPLPRHRRLARLAVLRV